MVSDSNSKTTSTLPTPSEDQPAKASQGSETGALLRDESGRADETANKSALAAEKNAHLLTIRRLAEAERQLQSANVEIVDLKARLHALESRDSTANTSACTVSGEEGKEPVLGEGASDSGPSAQDVAIIPSSTSHSSQTADSGQVNTLTFNERSEKTGTCGPQKVVEQEILLEEIGSPGNGSLRTLPAPASSSRQRTRTPVFTNQYKLKSNDTGTAENKQGISARSRPAAGGAGLWSAKVTLKPAQRGSTLGSGLISRLKDAEVSNRNTSNRIHLPMSRNESSTAGRRVYEVADLCSQLCKANDQNSAKYNKALQDLKIFKSQAMVRVAKALIAANGGPVRRLHASGTRRSHSEGNTLYGCGPREPPVRGSGVEQASHSGPRAYDFSNVRGSLVLDMAQEPGPSLSAPVEKLKISENAWKRRRDDDDETTAKVKQVRSLLNKLTPEKFDKILRQILEVEITNIEMLRRIVKEVFEKAVLETKFGFLYAELCTRLEGTTAKMLSEANIKDENGRNLTFTMVLRLYCQQEFMTIVNPGDAAAQSGGEKEEEPEVLMVKKQKAKRRAIANILFIGELFLKNLISQHILHRGCMARLMELLEGKEDDVIEAACKLLSKTGAKMTQNPKARDLVQGYFYKLTMLAKDTTIPSRTRFMILDLCDQRKNGWKVRLQEEKAKKISEIHADIAREDRQKELNLQRHQRRGGFSNGRGRRVQSSHRY